jgi:hypothetical protein
MPPAADRLCSLPECRKPADRKKAGGAYCPEHREELNLVRVLATRVLRTPPKRRPARERAEHPDPRRAFR